jgi:uncharacterized surface protein with fasciclin (FAS1) repeats
MLDGYVNAKKVTSLNDKTLDTLAGTQLRVKIVNKAVTIDGAAFASPMMECYRGLVHVIDKVLIRKE